MHDDVWTRPSTILSGIHEHPLPHANMRDDVLEGLLSRPKRLSPKYFYDEAGSRLFERICRLPEYYPTKTEIGILKRNRHEIAHLIGPGAVIIEYGSGASEKVRVLLESTHDPRAYVPVDISRDHLIHSATDLAATYPDLPVIAISADFTKSFLLPELPGRPIGFFPGSTIGNFMPAEARDFMRDAGDTLGSGAALIVGFDLVKDRKILQSAYDDPAGITAAFNRNILVRFNRELGTSFPIDDFEHMAEFNAAESRIEMHLRARRPLNVRIGDVEVGFENGETIHTENSYKYTLDRIRILAAESGWKIDRIWTDPQNWFAVAAFRRD